MRAAGVEAFEYASARDSKGGINVALFEPRALSSRRPLFTQSWLCETRADNVLLSNARDGAQYAFGIEEFLVEGRFPRAAD